MTSYKIRKIILEQAKRAHVGHIGSALSIVDILSVLFGNILYLPGIHDSTRDRFILSKGHAALALYAALYLKGILTDEQLQSYCTDGSLLGVHPEYQLSGIEFSTGSLGQGLAFGAGLAFAARLRGDTYRTFVLISDAECNEGSIWETVMFAAHHHLSNLVAIVDNNGQQAFGKTQDVLNLHPLREKWQAFGWNVHEVNGHDVTALYKTLAGLDPRCGAPTALIANTVSGKGVSFMEGQIAWHYLPLSDDQYQQAMREIEVAG